MDGSFNRIAVLIAGPTASGKSAVAMEVAEQMNGVIINADAMQLYKELEVLTSRPSTDDERRVPHRLFGCVAGAEAWSSGRWLTAARDAMETAWSKGQVPVVAGGTGLYFKVLEEGLSPVPAIPAEVRLHWRARMEAEGPAALHAELARRAPDDAARLDRQDSQRIVRALEVVDATGSPLSEHFGKARDGAVLAGAAVRRAVMMPPREELYAACDARFEAMLARGAVEEVRALLDAGLAADLPVMKAIGVKPLAALLAGEMTEAEAIALTQRQTRNYAKRQMTWIRNQMNAWPVFEHRDRAIRALLDG